MELALAGASPASLLVVLLMLVGGGVLYVAPRRRYRALGHAGLSLGWALATGRYLGLGAGLAVAAVGLLLTWLLDVAEEPGDEGLGVPMRLLLALFAAIATAALIVGRPLGAASALDANAAWYWSAALGLLLLLSERGARSTALGGALVVAAAGLAVLHLMPGPPLALPLACALLAVALAAAGRGLQLPETLLEARAGLVVDGVLAACALGLLVGLTGRTLAVGEASLELGPGTLPIAVAAVVLGGGLALHARLAGLPGAAGLSWGALAGAVVAVLALATGAPPVAGVVAAAAPALVAVLARARAAPLLLVAAAAGACAAALGLVEQSQASEASPGLARVGLALVLVHAGLLGALAPAHLWALGMAPRGDGRAEQPDETPALLLAVALGIGSLASLGLLVGAAERYEWLLAVTGARPLVAAVAVLGIAVAGVALLAEQRLGRLVLLLGAVSGAVALMVPASADARTIPAAAAMLTDRAVALALALVGADAVVRWRPGRAVALGQRLLRLDAVPLWVGLAGLLGPPIGARLDGLVALAADRPELAGLALVASVLGLVGAKRAADAVATDGAESKEPDERPPAWRRLVPLVLSGLYAVYVLL